MTTIERRKTAMSRTNLSAPMQLAFNDGLLDGATVFDYGCGRGDDVRTLNALGVEASGWDPGHAPDNPILEADVVNLGFVVNVIEDPLERADALQRAWKLAKKVLVVSARLIWDRDAGTGRPFRDGQITAKGTFQKYYEPDQLKAWIESTLGQTAVTGAPGTIYIFRDPAAAQQLLARHSRQSRRPRRGIAEILYEQHRELLRECHDFVAEHRKLPNAGELQDASALIERFGSIRGAFSVIAAATGPGNWPDVDTGTQKTSVRRFEEHLDELQPLIDFVSERGRLPREGELRNDAELVSIFGSPRAAFSLVRRVTGHQRWESMERAAAANFLVYSALSAFGGRPKFGDLPGDLQYDAKDLFGSYSKACAEADKLLYSIADMTAVSSACQESTFGKLTPEALYIHSGYVSDLPPLLRVYVGAAQVVSGNVDDATLLKINRQKPQVSFLVYPTFDTDPHPALEASIVAKLGAIRLKHRYFGGSDNPPILHRKETFVPADYPGYAKFARLTRQEERAGLLDRNDIGRSEDWKQVVEAAGYQLRGHSLRRL